MREVPNKLYYVNGKPGLSIGISMAAGQNVVESRAPCQTRCSSRWCR